MAGEGDYVYHQDGVGHSETDVTHAKEFLTTFFSSEVYNNM